jgi:hypothetical protein
MKNFTNLLIFLGIISFFIMGCAKSDDSSSSSASASASDGDTDTEVSASSGSGALTLSSKVSLVSANSSASATSRTAFSHFGSDNFTSDKDISVDKTETFVYERSADAFKTANNILCWMGQSRAGLMLGTGDYKAQIDKSKCGESDGNSNAPKYEMWTVNSTRADGEPMIVKAWIPFDSDENGETDSRIYAMSKVYRSPSAEYPWGHFKMSFRLVQGNTTSGTELFKGYLRTKKKKNGSSVLQFYNPEPDGSGNILQYSVSVKKNSDGSGTAITTVPQWGQSGPTGKQKTYKIAFSDNYFYKQKTVTGADPSDPVCLRRDNYLQAAYRYGLYHDNGSRLNINSGFPIKATKSVSGVDKYYYGYIGYYGLWMPSAASVDNGSTVAKMDFGGAANQTGTNYTVRSWPGKLTKWTKNTISLSTIKNIPIFWRDRSDSYKNKRIYWNGSVFKINGEENSSTYMMEDVSESTLPLNSSTVPYGLHFYSQALGGDGSVQLTYGSPPSHTTPSAPSDSTSVIFNTRASVFPGDSVPSKLACYERCPDPATIASGTDSTVYRNFNGTDNASATSAYIYSFDNTTNGMILKQDNDSASVVLASANSNLEWGVNSGLLFDNTTANFNSLRCSWDNDSICPWDARQSLSSFYTWETGTKDWQKLTVLVASDNTSVKFEPPLSVKYTHSGTGSNSGKSYDNSSFYLEYGGFGNLWGLPSFCISRKNGDKVSCANDGSTRWVEDILIPAYGDVTQTADGSTNYIVKPLEIEQTMKKASSASVCKNAGLAFGDISLPDSSGYTKPDMEVMPVVEGPPAVVGGVRM